MKHTSCTIQLSCLWQLLDVNIFVILIAPLLFPCMKPMPKYVFANLYGSSCVGSIPVLKLITAI